MKKVKKIRRCAGDGQADCAGGRLAAGKVLAPIETKSLNLGALLEIGRQLRKLKNLPVPTMVDSQELVLVFVDTFEQAQDFQEHAATRPWRQLFYLKAVMSKSLVHTVKFFNFKECRMIEVAKLTLQQRVWLGKRHIYGMSLEDFEQRINNQRAFINTFFHGTSIPVGVHGLDPHRLRLDPTYKRALETSMASDDPRSLVLFASWSEREWHDFKRFCVHHRLADVYRFARVEQRDERSWQGYKNCRYYAPNGASGVFMTYSHRHNIVPIAQQDMVIKARTAKLAASIAACDEEVETVDLQSVIGTEGMKKLNQRPKDSELSMLCRGGQRPTIEVRCSKADYLELLACSIRVNLHRFFLFKHVERSR